MIRKIILLLFFYICATIPSFADYIPYYASRNLFLGNGFITSKEQINVHLKDDVNSEILLVLKAGKAVTKGVAPVRYEDIYSAIVERYGLYLIPVKTDTDDWYEICISQKNKLFGWVKKDENIDFISWEDFLNFYGRKYGLYVFRNVEDVYKKLYSSADETSNVVNTFFYPKHISLWLISGDWMLVKVTTYDGKTKTGWLKWRLDDGTIIVFPNFLE